MFSPLQNKQFDEESGSVCFLCSRSSHQENVAFSGRRKEKRSGRMNNNKSKVDFEQFSSSSKPQTQNAAKRILLKYLVGRCEDEELKGNLLSSNFPINFCNECKGSAKEVQDLHLQLERIQMMLIDKLKTMKELIVQNSITFREWSEGGVRNDGDADNNGEEGTGLIQLAHHFRTFIGIDDTNQLDVPLVFLEKFVGSKTFPEIMSSTSKPNQANLMQAKHVNDCQPKTEYIPEQIQEPGDSLDSTVQVRKPQSKQPLRGEYEADVKEELEVDENPAGDDASDVDFAPVNFQSDSEDSTAPEIPSTSTTRKTGNNHHTASSLEIHSRRVHHSTPIICEICGFTTKHKDFLRRHHRRMHDPEYQLQRKMKLAVKKFECSVCPKKFATGWVLKDHMLTHSAETPFHCDFCGQAFKRKTTLKFHMVSIHGHGDVKHNCSECSKSFPTKSKLMHHMSSHSDEKKFACDLCGKRFKKKSSIKEHVMNVHTSLQNEHVCEECGKDFFLSSNLKKHLLVHAKGGRTRLKKRGVRKQVSEVVNVT